jgi:hypothetical protein
MAADSAIIVLIDIFRLLVRSGVIAALLSTQTPAASDHSINHEPPAMDQRRQAMAGFGGGSGAANSSNAILPGCRNITADVSDGTAARMRSPGQ